MKKTEQMPPKLNDTGRSPCIFSSLSSCNDVTSPAPSVSVSGRLKIDEFQAADSAHVSQLYLKGTWICLIVFDYNKLGFTSMKLYFSRQNDDRDTSNVDYLYP